MKRNVAYGPGNVNLDFPVIKQCKLGELFNLELRGEVFNILNHPHFATADHNLTDSHPNHTVRVSSFTSDIFAATP